MDEYLRVLIDEIALEGPHGHPAADLAGLLSASTGHQIDRGVVSLLWPALIRHPDARFETEPEDAPPAPMPPPHLLDKQVHALSSTSVGCKVVHRSAPALRTFAGALEHYRQRKLRLRVVASTTYRHRMLGVLNDNPFELTPVMLFVLEQAAKSRERGFPQSEVSRILSIDPRTIFSMVKSLEQAGLIFRIPFFKPGLSRTNLIVLSRFAGMSVAAALNVASRGDTSLVEEFTGIPIFLFDSARQIILSHLRASKNHSMSYDTARQLVAPLLGIRQVTRTERKADSRAPDVEPGESNDSPEQLAEVSEPAGETPQPPPAPAPTGSGCGAIVVASTGKNQEARLVRLLSRIIRSLVEMGHIEKFYTHSEGTMVMSIGLLNKSAGPAAPGRDGSSAADPASSFASVDAPRPEYLFALDRPAHLPIHHSIFRLVATAPQGVSTTRQLSIRLCTFVRTQLRLCREVGASGAIRMDNIGNVGRERHILFEPPTNLAEIAHRYGLQFDRSGHCFVNALMDASLLDAPPREVDTKDVVRMVDPDNPLALELDSRIRGGISTSRQYYSLNVVSQVRALRLALHIQRDPIIYETTLVRKLASQPLSPNDRQFLDSTGMDRRTIRRIIDVLVKANVIRVQAIRESEALDPSGTLTAEYGPDAPESSRREHDVLIGCVTPVDRARILEMVGDYVRRRRQRMAAGPAALSTRNQEVSFLEDLVLEEAADDRITLLADIASRAAEATPDADLPDEKPAVAVGQAGLTALEAAPAKRLTSRWTSTGDVGAGGGAMRATAARLLGRRALLDARSARGMFPGMDTPGAEAPDSDAGSMGEVDRVPVAPVHLRKIERLRVLYFHLHQMSSAPVAGSPDEEFPFIEGAQLMKSLTLGVLVRALGVQSDSQERLVRHLQRSTHAPVTSAGAPSTILLSRQLASVPVDWLPDQARREALLSVGWLMQPRLPAAVGPEGSAAPVATASTDVATATPTKYRILRSLPLGGATAGLGTGVGSVIMLNLLECLEELGLLQFEEQCGLSVLEFPMDRPLRPVPRFLASTFGTATGSSTDGTVAHGGLLSQSQDMVRVLVPARFRLVRHVRLKSPGDEPAAAPVLEFDTRHSTQLSALWLALCRSPSRMSSQQVSAAVAAATGGQRLQALPLRRLPSTTISSIRWRLHKASRLQPGVVQAFGRDASRPGRPELLSPSWAGRPVTYSDDGNDDDDDDDDGHSSGHDGELASSGLRRRGLSDDDDHDDEDGDRGHSGRGARASGRRRRPRSQSARRSASAFSNSVSTGLIGPIRADTFDLGDSDEEAGGKSARLGQRRKRIPWDALSTQLSVAACQRRMISLRTGNPQLEGFIRDRQRIRRNLWTAQYGPRGTQLHESHELWISRDIMSEEELLSEVDRWPPIEEHYLRSLAEGDGGPASMDVDMSTAASADAPAAEVATFTPGRHNLPGYKPLPRLLRNHADFVHTYRPVRTASSRPPFESSMQGTARLSRLVQRNMWTSFGLAAGVTPPSRRAASAQDTRASLMPGLGPGCGPDALTLPRWVVAGPLRNPHLQGANGSSGGAGGAASADRHAEHNAWQVRGALSASLQDRRHYLSGNYIRSNHQPAAGSPNPLLALEDSCTTAPGTGRTLWDMASTGWQPPTTGPVTPTGPIVACDHLLAFPPTSEADRAEHFFQALNLIKSVLLQPGKSVDPLIIYLLARQLPTTAFEAAFSSSEKLGMIQLAAPSVIVAPSAGSAAMANAPAATAPTATSDSMTVESPAPVATPASVASPLSPVAPAGSVSPSATGAPASALCSTATHPAAASGAASASGNASSGAPAPREALATVSTPARPLNVTERFLAALFGTSSALSNASGSSQDGAVAALLAGATACHAALTRDLAPAESLFDDVASASATETTTSHEDEETPAFTLPMVWHGGAVACILGLRHTGRISILPQFDHFPLGLGADRSHAPHGAGGSLAGATGPASTSGGSSLNGGDVQSPGAGGDLASGPQSPSAASVAGEQNDGLDSLRQLAFAHGRYGRSGVSLLESLQLVVQPAWANSALAGQHGQDPRQPTAAPAQRTPRSLQLTSLLESPSCPAAGPGATATSVATVPARRVPPGQEEPSSDPHALAEPLRSATLLGPRPAIPLAPHATGLDPSTVPGSERWAPALHQWLLSLGWHASLRADEALGLGAGAHGVGFSQEVALLPHTLLFASIWRAGSAGVRESIVARDPALAAFSFEHIHLALAHLVGFGLVIREGHVKTTLLASPFFLEQMDRSRVRLPRRPWSDLAAGYNRQLFDSFQHALIRQMVLTGGVADEPTLLAAMAELVSMGDLRDLLDHLICLRVLLPDLAVALAQPGSFADTVISMEESTGQATITTAGAFLRCHLGINAAPFDHYGGLGLSPAEEQAGRLPSREDPPSRRSAHTAIRVRRSFRLSPVWFERANHSISATEFLNLRGDQSQPHFPPVGTAATIARDTETVAQSAG